MNTQTVTIVLLAVMVSFIGIQAYQINGLKDSITGNAVSPVISNTGKIDMAGWSEDEKMNYDMHGIIPSRAKTSGGSPSSAPTMVGGC
ncbi:hypothetical protein HYT57_04080 [Candidatus Woesearchaeota archaeon]|nr:hypothetical protein [Candidatus Woesearchaeota archaeon]